MIQIKEIKQFSDFLETENFTISSSSIVSGFLLERKTSQI